MSDRDLRNLYEGVSRGDTYIAPRRVNELYKAVLYEEDEPPIVSRDNNNEPDRITLFYTLDNNTYNNLKSVPGVEQIQMDYEYFLDNVKGRLDQKMKVAVDDLTLMGLNGKQDPVATRGLYDVFAKYHITGDAACALHNSLKETGHNDYLYDAFAGISGGFGVISIIPTLIQNLENRGFDFGPAKDNPVAFLNDLWDVKDVKGRTSVGRGELCMSLLSIAIKGEPGDVKFQPGEEKVPDRLSQPGITHAKLHLGNKGVAIEVKGSGGRPGKGKEADKFVDKVLKLMKSTEIDPQQKVTYSQANNDQKNLVDSTQKFVRVYKKTGDEAIQIVFDIIDKKIKTLKPETNNIIRSEIDNTRQQLWNYLNDGNNFQDINNQSVVIKYLTDWLRNWNKLIGPHLRIGKPDTNMQILTKPGKGRSAGIFHILHEREFLVGDEKSLLSSMTGQFKQAVLTYFTQLAFSSKTNSLVISSETLAQALWSTRADAAKVVQCPFISDLADIIETEPGILKDESRLALLVGCIQVTAYCIDDKFTHAMFVNDESPEKKSLVVQCQADDPSVTFSNLYNAFVSNDVTVDLAIDAQNKGVQIFFKG